MGERLGFIGLGIMGTGMVDNLVRAGHHVTVWNRSPRATMAGTTLAPDLPSLFAATDLVMLSVSDTPDVIEVIETARPHLRPGQLIVDHSTISPVATRQLAASLHGQAWLDAPVSGGSEGAANGTLSVMVGGAAPDLDRARPYLSAYSTTITHMGPLGSGQLAKAVNQILVVGNQLAASEALFFAEAAGLDLGRTIEAVKGGAGGSWMLANRGPQMIAADWRPGFTIDLQQKDLRIALEAADQMGVPLPGTALIFQLYRALQSAGLGSDGNHALIKALKQMAGTGAGA